MRRSAVISTAITEHNAKTNGEFEGFQTQATINISKYYHGICLEALKKTRTLSSEDNLCTSQHCNRAPADTIQRITATTNWSAEQHTDIWHIYGVLYESLALCLWHGYNPSSKCVTSSNKLNKTVFPSYMNLPLHFHHSSSTFWATNFNTKKREVAKLSHFRLCTFKRGHYLLCILVTPT
jgi:hypothetical protein